MYPLFQHFLSPSCILSKKDIQNKKIFTRLILQELERFDTEKHFYELVNSEEIQLFYLLSTLNIGILQIILDTVHYLKLIQYAEKMMHRFEVDKKIFQHYTQKTERLVGFGDEVTDDDYNLFGLLMLFTYYATDDLRFLNTGLKNRNVTSNLYKTFLDELEKI